MRILIESCAFSLAVAVIMIKVRVSNHAVWLLITIQSRGRAVVPTDLEFAHLYAFSNELRAFRDSAVCEAL